MCSPAPPAFGDVLANHAPQLLADRALVALGEGFEGIGGRGVYTCRKVNRPVFIDFSHGEKRTRGCGGNGQSAAARDPSATLLL